MDEGKVLRELAKTWIEKANLPIVKERKRLWKALKDLKAERPMIYAESWGIFDDSKLLCSNIFLRKVEMSMREIIEHFEDIGDDIVIEPYFRIPWRVILSDYGMPFEEHHAQDSSGRQFGYTFEFPIKIPDDVKRLKKRTYKVDREYTLLCKEKLENIFGDILPVRVGNFDYFNPEPGYNPFIGINFIALSYDVFRLIGNDRLIYWVYDHPDTLHEISRHIFTNSLAFYKWLEDENLLDNNTDNQFSGPGSYGYVSSLPEVGGYKKVYLKDLWGRSESQEGIVLSPGMFNEFFLFYIEKICKLFGMIYYGCCEPLDDRFDYIRKAIPNLRAVSVSGWSNLHKMGEIIGKDYVYSRKPKPSYISGAAANWDGAKNDMINTLEAAKNCNLEIILRDVIDFGRDKDRIKKWVSMTKSVMNF
ncbi:MAG: hypothetical protein M1475_07960 [Actinobacteria bacterium]|nr:hypothetical protein [Actinomycetota bacterium]